LYLETTTYEISLPVLRDPTLAPEGCSALLVSCLFSYELTRRIEVQGWYEEAKSICEQTILRVLSENLYPELPSHVLESFSSTPTSLERLTANSEGAITGWAFTGGNIPVIHSMQDITKSVRTEFETISQAGQWAFSPSGLPISVMTGKLAGERAIKAAKHEKSHG
jgi:phytoene dehydrogenase-like protein